jgi:dihydroorotate dehydrogenase
MGFNNEGAVALARRLEKRPEHLIVGINIGKNRDTPLEEAYKDYVTAFQTLQDAGDFFVLNVSSPNTPGLRSLQSEKNLLPIIDAVQAINTKHKPLLLKLSPDLPLEAIEEIGKVATGAGIAGFVAGNTTTQIKYPALGEGGVSGKPLRPLRKRLVEALRPFRLPIIGVGGIASGADIRECLLEGAELVEIYTGLIYKGPGLVREGLEAVSASHLRTP